VRKELDLYGHDETGRKFMEMQTYRRDMIMKQQNQGLGGAFKNVNKLGGGAGLPGA
jgi:hypothetical protein